MLPGITRNALSRGWDGVRARWARADAHDVASALLFAALLVLVFCTYGSYSVSNDEGVQRHYGELILRYYASGFANQSLFHFDNLYLYGGLFDVVAALLERALPLADAYSIRHILCALCGIAGIAGTWALARLVAGPRAGLIAALTLSVCGTWYGAMFNHTKDVPFAAAMIWAVVFIVRIARSRRDVLLFGLMLGGALGLRVLGLLLVGYVALAILAETIRGRRDARERLGYFATSALNVAPAFLLAYVIMIAAWPWSAQAPLNPIRGLLEFGAFNYGIRTVFDGQIYTMGSVPRWYVPAYFAIKLPLVMLIGAAVAAAVTALPLRKAVRRETFMIVFVAAFPVACEVIDRGPAFSGVRHFLFVVPLLAVLAGIGFDWALAQLASRRRILATAGQAALAAAILWNAGTLVRLHPYEYLYYNPLVGGLEGANGRYITDYWVNIMGEAVDLLEAHVAALDRTTFHPQRYTVAVCGERVPFEKEANARLQFTGDWRAAEFFIAPSHMNCDRALDGAVVATISRVGAQIGVVKDRRRLVAPALASHP